MGARWKWNAECKSCGESFSGFSGGPSDCPKCGSAEVVEVIDCTGANPRFHPIDEWQLEREMVLRTFTQLLGAATGDGSKKRQAGEKPPWWRDDSHEAAIFSHLNKWKHGELKDKDSGAHPLVHAAWRCLAIAYQECYGKVDPAEGTPIAPSTSGYS